MIMLTYTLTIFQSKKFWTIKMKTFYVFLIFLLFAPASLSFAETYWVSPTGAAAWSSCKGETPLEGTAACPISSVSSGSKSPGDIIYFRGGDYNYSTLNGQHISLTDVNGSDGQPILFSAYNDEEVRLNGTYGTRMWGLLIQSSSYLKFYKLIFTDYSDYLIRASSHHLEFSHCVFKSDTSPYRSGSFQMVEDCGGGSSYHCPVSHIWIHNSTFYKMAAGGGCSGGVISEGGDPLRVGHHSLICGTGYTTSSSSNSIGTGEKTFTVSSGLLFLAGNQIRVQSGSSYMIGRVSSYSGSTLVFNSGSSSGSGTYDSWNIGICATGNNSNITVEDNYMAHGGHVVFENYGIYSVVRNNISHNEPWYPADNGECSVNYPATYTNENYNGLYSHRVWQITDTHDREYSFNLYENNRLGHAGVNPNNNGATGLTIASPGNVIRYNSAFGTMHNPMKTKYGDGYGWQASGGTRNRIFNNTLFKGGYGYQPFMDASPWPLPLQGFRWYAPSDSAGNVLKNNIVYGSYGAVEEGLDDIQDCTSSPNSVMVNNFCTNADAEKCTHYGDPLFVDPDLTQVSSSTLPDLRLKAASPAINRGAHLTTVHADDTSSGEILKVEDALYFQDGTWGSSLAGHTADWIAVGTVSNVVQISSINYSTNTITLADSITRNDGDPVWLYKKSDGEIVLSGSAPDYGAYEHDSGSTPDPERAIVQGVMIGGGGSKPIISPSGVRPTIH